MAEEERRRWNGYDSTLPSQHAPAPVVEERPTTGPGKYVGRRVTFLGYGDEPTTGGEFVVGEKLEVVDVGIDPGDNKVLKVARVLQFGGLDHGGSSYVYPGEVGLRIKGARGTTGRPRPDGLGFRSLLGPRPPRRVVDVARDLVGTVHEFVMSPGTDW